MNKPLFNYSDAAEAREALKNVGVEIDLREANDAVSGLTAGGPGSGRHSEENAIEEHQRKADEFYEKSESPGDSAELSGRAHESSARAIKSDNSRDHEDAAWAHYKAAKSNSDPDIAENHARLQEYHSDRARATYRPPTLGAGYGVKLPPSLRK